MSFLWRPLSCFACSLKWKPCAGQPLSGTQIERPKQRLCSCCIMNVLMSLSRLESPAGLHLNDPLHSAASSAKFSFKVHPRIYFRPKNKFMEIQGPNIFLSLLSPMWCCIFNINLKLKRLTQVTHSSMFSTIPDCSFSNSNHGRVRSAAKQRVFFVIKVMSSDCCFSRAHFTGRL